jgi:para-aminobenzoate synthetase/4-amino-4-deoxychorismate lyase
MPSPLHAEAEALATTSDAGAQTECPPPQWCSFETLPGMLRVPAPVRAVVAHRLEHVVSALTQVVEACEEEGLGALGFLSYEAAAAFEAAAATSSVPQVSDFPLLWFALYRPSDGAGPPPLPPPLPPSPGPRFSTGAWVPDVGQEEYTAAIHAVRASIKAGNVYQINYTLRLAAPFAGDPSAFAERLAAAQQCGYAAFLDTGRFAIASASPELFFHWNRTTGELTTRPMKGTRRRGLGSQSDAVEAAALSSSAKDVAENLMIVDLLRNDLGRIAVPGSVRVRDLFKIERYPTVLQMTSTVQARTPAGTSLLSVLRALFPCGSITGAPKLSAMRGIAKLEGSQRHVYCGAIMHLAPGKGGDVTASVPIRTVIVDRADGVAHYGVGGGVTWDSTPSGEYDEVLAKAAVLRAAADAEASGAPHPVPAEAGAAWAPAFRLLETLRLERGDGAPLTRYAYLEGHLARMAASAAYFVFPWPEEGLQAALRAEAEGQRGAAPRRVRLLLDSRGGVTCESTELAPSPPGRAPYDEGKEESADTGAVPAVCVLAARPTPRTSIMLYHKTTDRRLYDAARAEALGDALDVLLWNEEGHVQEFTIGNIVLELPTADGGWHLVTPPVSAGVLPGVLRDAVLAAGRVVEADVAMEALHTARRVWLLNSVRGWVRVEVSRRARQRPNSSASPASA